MRKIAIYAFSLLLSVSAFAQNNQGKADDAARISITPIVSDQEIPQGSKNMLINKMKQICSKNGMAGDSENPFFVMDASVDVLSKELTPTAPPMHAMNLTINLEIKDNMTGNVYSQTSIDVKGVGKNETKAYSEGIKRMNTNSGQFKAFVEKGKERIIEFYNSDCDIVLSKGNALYKQGDNGEAINVLKSVPPVCKECYDKCMELLAQIEPTPEELQDEESTGKPASNTPAAEPTGAAAAGATTTAASATALDVKLGDKVMAELTGGEFKYQRYTPSKIVSLASAATKNEYEVMSMGEGGSENKWTANIITTWHKAKKEDFKDGVVVLYDRYEISETTELEVGVIVSIDELYKNTVSIKGRYNDIYKIPLNQVIIPDNPVLQKP